MIGPVFVTGGTGYLGRPLIAELVARKHEVHALAREASLSRLPAGTRTIVGNALDPATFVEAIPRGATVVHLVGTPHPSPAKASEFRSVDLVSIRSVAAAAKSTGARHLVYVSAAHPAPVMKAYIEARVAGEALVRETGVPATILRPWYVLGPGHRWPYALIPIYGILRLIPATREGSLRLGLVTRRAMVNSLVRAVENTPAAGVRIVEVPQIRAAA